MFPIPLSRNTLLEPDIPEVHIFLQPSNLWGKLISNLQPCPNSWFLLRNTFHLAVYAYLDHPLTSAIWPPKTCPAVAPVRPLHPRWAYVHLIHVSYEPPNTYISLTSLPTAQESSCHSPLGTFDVITLFVDLPRITIRLRNAKWCPYELLWWPVLLMLTYLPNS